MKDDKIKYRGIQDLSKGAFRLETEKIEKPCKLLECRLVAYSDCKLETKTGITETVEVHLLYTDTGRDQTLSTANLVNNKEVRFIFEEEVIISGREKVYMICTNNNATGCVEGIIEMIPLEKMRGG